jgi:membrane-bound lytic murein transglycosylase D
MFYDTLRRVAMAACCCCALSLCGGAQAATDVPSKAGAPTIWTHIVAGMQLPARETPETVARAQTYARRTDLVEAMLARSEPFLWHIVNATERRRMPLELALLPAVESGFDPRAHSPQQAAGLWQFVPTTSAIFGLQTTRDYDARRDPIASTRAALGHLSDMYEYFGDWWLAVAAYNVGLGNLSNILKAQPGTTDIWTLKLPAETFEHVRRLAAISLLIEQPQRFGITLPNIADAPVTEVVPLRGAIDLHAATQAAGVSAALIRQYNPGLGTLVNTTGKKSLMLPTADAARLRAALATRTFPAQARPQTVVHVIQPGDSLWRIATHYRVSIEDLRSWNELGEHSVLHPGRRLRVPTSL